MLVIGKYTGHFVLGLIAHVDILTGGLSGSTECLCIVFGEEKLVAGICRFLQIGTRGSIAEAVSLERVTSFKVYKGIPLTMHKLISLNGKGITIKRSPTPITTTGEAELYRNGITINFRQVAQQTGYVFVIVHAQGIVLIFGVECCICSIQCLQTDNVSTL